jgi:hypothetical protein
MDRGAWGRCQGAGRRSGGGPKPLLHALETTSLHWPPSEATFVVDYCCQRENQTTDYRERINQSIMAAPPRSGCPRGHGGLKPLLMLHAPWGLLHSTGHHANNARCTWLELERESLTPTPPPSLPFPTRNKKAKCRTAEPLWSEPDYSLYI